MANTLRFILALALCCSRAVFAQARVVSAPPDPSLLFLTSGWARASILGDLREMRTGRDYLELRVWGGFGLTTNTQGIVLRRNEGRWSAFLARVLRCEIQISKSVADTASRSTRQGYLAEARRKCGTPLAEVGPGARILTTDSLVVDRLDLADSAIANAWTAAERAGVSDLPGRVNRDRTIDDAFMYVVELRRGNEYRASIIEHLERPETKADQQVEEVYAAVNRILAPDLRLTP